MDPNRKITKKFTKKFDSKVINRQYFHRRTGLKKEILVCLVVFTYQFFFFQYVPDRSLANFKIGLSNVYLTSDDSDTSNYSVLGCF